MKIRVLRGFWYPIGKANMPVMKDGQVDLKKTPVLDVPPAVAKELVAMQKAEFVDAEAEAEANARGPMTTKTASAAVG